MRIKQKENLLFSLDFINKQVKEIYRDYKSDKNITDNLKMLIDNIRVITIESQDLK